MFLLAALCACNPAALMPGDERPAVGVDLSLAIAPIEDATPGTKTDYEPDYWSSIADAGERAVDGRRCGRRCLDRPAFCR